MMMMLIKVPYDIGSVKKERMLSQYLCYFHLQHDIEQKQLLEKERAIIQRDYSIHLFNFITCNSEGPTQLEANFENNAMSTQYQLIKTIGQYKLHNLVAKFVIKKTGADQWIDLLTMRKLE